MHKFFTDIQNISDYNIKILGEDVKHIYKVLRLTEGTKIIINDCMGNEYLCNIDEITKAQVRATIIEKIEEFNESPLEVTLYQGIPKAQKMDLIVQKGTELGVLKFVPVVTKRVDVKLKGEFKKLDRLNRIVLEAAKQSKRSIIPKVYEPIEFSKVINKIKDVDLFLVPYENAEDFGVKSVLKDIKNLESIKKIGIFVGPEGGFEELEIDDLKKSGAYIVTLGKRILRTETAGFALTSVLQYELGDLGGEQQ